MFPFVLKFGRVLTIEAGLRSLYLRVGRRDWYFGRV